MTTVAYKAGELAADTRSTEDNFAYPEHVQKLFKLPDGSIMGGAGTLEDLNRLYSMMCDGKKPTGNLDCSCLMLDTKRRLHMFEGRIWIRAKGVKFTAVGSGKQIAIGAMAAGASATEAVKIACKYDIYSGGPVRSLHVKN